MDEREMSKRKKIKRYWVWSAWECHDPYDFRGSFHTLKEAKNAFPNGEEVAEIYDVWQERVMVFWSGTEYARPKGWSEWEPAKPR